MVGQIINVRNGVNTTTNTLSSKRGEEQVVENRIINRNNGTNDSTNIIHNEAQTIYATNQIINIYEYPDSGCSPPPAPDYSYNYNCPPWNCCANQWSAWPCCCGMWNCFFSPPLWGMMMLPFFVM